MKDEGVMAVMQGLSLLLDEGWGMKDEGGLYRKGLVYIR